MKIISWYKDIGNNTVFVIQEFDRPVFIVYLDTAITNTLKYYYIHKHLYYMYRVSRIVSSSTCRFFTF